MIMFERVLLLTLSLVAVITTRAHNVHAVLEGKSIMTWLRGTDEPHRADETIITGYKPILQLHKFNGVHIQPLVEAPTAFVPPPPSMVSEHIVATPDRQMIDLLYDAAPYLPEMDHLHEVEFGPWQPYIQSMSEESFDRIHETVEIEGEARVGLPSKDKLLKFLQLLKEKKLKPFRDAYLMKKNFIQNAMNLLNPVSPPPPPPPPSPPSPPAAPAMVHFYIPQAPLSDALITPPAHSLHTLPLPPSPPSFYFAPQPLPSMPYTLTRPVAAFPAGPQGFFEHPQFHQLADGMSHMDMPFPPPAPTIPVHEEVPAPVPVSPLVDLLSAHDLHAEASENEEHVSASSANTTASLFRLERIDDSQNVVPTETSTLSTSSMPVVIVTEEPQPHERPSRDLNKTEEDLPPSTQMPELPDTPIRNRTLRQVPFPPKPEGEEHRIRVNTRQARCFGRACIHEPQYPPPYYYPLPSFEQQPIPNYPRVGFRPRQEPQVVVIKIEQDGKPEAKDEDKSEDKPADKAQANQTSEGCVECEQNRTETAVRESESSPRIVRDTHKPPAEFYPAASYFYTVKDIAALVWPRILPNPLKIFQPPAKPVVDKPILERSVENHQVPDDCVECTQNPDTTEEPETGSSPRIVRDIRRPPPLGLRTPDFDIRIRPKREVQDHQVPEDCVECKQNPNITAEPEPESSPRPVRDIRIPPPPASMPLTTVEDIRRPPPLGSMTPDFDIRIRPKRELQDHQVPEDCVGCKKNPNMTAESKPELLPRPVRDTRRPPPTSAPFGELAEPRDIRRPKRQYDDFEETEDEVRPSHNLINPFEVALRILDGVIQPLRQVIREVAIATAESSVHRRGYGLADLRRPKREIQDQQVPEDCVGCKQNPNMTAEPEPESLPRLVREIR